MGIVSDPIAELLTNLRNASKAERRYIDIAHSKLKEEIVKILKENGFIAHFLIKEEKRKKTMRVFLKFGPNREEVIHGLKRVSKPSLRQYIASSDIPRVFGGMGIAILSTPKGVLEGRRARREKVGGELLCLAW